MTSRASIAVARAGLARYSRMTVRSRHAIGTLIVLVVFAVVLVNEALRDGFRDALGGLAGLVAATGVWLAISNDD